MSKEINSLKPFRDKDGTLNAVMETPQGSRAKYSYNHDTGMFELSKMLPAGMAFPYDFGFIPGTKAADGDAIDVLIFLEACVPMGCVIPCRAIGIIEAEQSDDEGKMIPNHRIVAVACECKSNPLSKTRSLKDVDQELLRELEQFFVNYNKVQKKEFKLLGCHGPKRALEAIRKAVK